MRFCFRDHCSHVIGYFSLYDLFAAVIDKPFIQEHGICILAGLGVGFFLYNITQTLIANYYKQVQDIMQSSVKELHDMHKDMLKALKRSKGSER